MSVLTRTHHTKSTKHKRADDSLPWEEVYSKEIEKYGEAEIALRGLRARENLTQKQLAERLNVSQHEGRQRF